MTYPSEVSAHLGVGFGPYARAHLGLLYDEPAPVAQPLPPGTAPLARTQRRTNLNLASWGTTGSGVVLRAPVTITEDELERIARRAETFATSPELQTWVSATLSSANARGVDVSTETRLAETWFDEVLRVSSSDKIVLLAAGLVALDFPTKIVAHGERQLTRVLAAVKSDGTWRYADPVRARRLGDAQPFEAERSRDVGASPKAAETEEIRAFKSLIEEQRRALDEARRVIEQQQALLATMVGPQQPSEATIAVDEALAVTLGQLSKPRASAPWVPIAAVAIILVAVAVVAVAASKAEDPEENDSV